MHGEIRMPDFRVFPQSELDNMHIANGMVRLDFKATFEMFQRVLDKLEADGKIQRVKPQK